MLEITDITADTLSSNFHFDRHVLVRTFNDPGSGLYGAIAIHRGSKQRPAFGATRFATYNTESEVIDESLKLAKLMSYKAALADLPYGGAKAVIMKPKETFNKIELLKMYCEVVNSLDGQFITGADLGISPEDVEVMKQYSPHIVGVYNDPVFFTALGIFHSIEQTVQEVWSQSDLKQRSFAVQGLGKIGEGVIQLIHPHTQNIMVTDINEKRITEITTDYPGVLSVNPQQIYEQQVDIFSPCAHGGVLDVQTIERLKCKVVLGGANNQLENEEVGDRLFEKGIMYVPDYVVNAGGLISVVDEYIHQHGNTERVLEHVLQISETVHELFEESETTNLPLHRVANKKAEKIFSMYE